MTDLTLSLQITALGMGLVFGAIILLWLMMIVLTFLTAEKDSPDEVPASDSPMPASVSETGFKLQAAALAVAVALAEQGQSTAHPLPDPPTAIVSAWQLGMRTRQSSEKGNFRRH
ncbi:MAG: OadG family protein [Anaerolineales bacterium]|jgi:Na+-transporting methylmalonyl-CoA/oxaloacetate decarboxylase gamma subunit|nr:OadG family protein [Anaerolineales bacterium]